MYLPVRVMKALMIVAQVYSSVRMKLVSIPPIIIIQAAAANILFPSRNGIDVDLLLS